MKVSVISLGVHNMELALEFYSEKLGLKVKSKQFYPELVELKNNVPIILYKVEDKVDLNYLKDAVTTIGFEVENVQESINELIQKNVDLIFNEPQPFPAGIMTAVKDPSGNIVELLEFKG